MNAGIWEASKMWSRRGVSYISFAMDLPYDSLMLGYCRRVLAEPRLPLSLQWRRLERSSDRQSCC